MNFKSVASALLRKAIGYKTKIVSVHFMGSEFKVTEGTIPLKADKDDAWFYLLAKNHNEIYDIGSNVGYASILASAPAHDKKIVLVDPNPIALSYAAGNLIRNNMSINKTFILSFVSDKSGEQVKFYTIDSGSAGSMFASHAETASKTNSFYMVNTLTLDEIMGKTGFAPDLVKVDIEGAESYALNGAIKLAGLQKAIFMVEMHAPAEMPMVKNATLVLQWCKENNYKAYYMAEHRQITTPEEIAHRGRCHLLLLPHNKEYPLYLNNMKEGQQLTHLQ